ncbi:MAG: AsmA-like C-terminal domain-containing protein [Pseudomonadota bacterium]
MGRQRRRSGAAAGAAPPVASALAWGSRPRRRRRGFLLVCARTGLRALVVFALLSTAAAALALYQLRRAPVSVPALASLAEDLIVRTNDRVVPNIGSAMLGIDRATGAPILSFHDVRLRRRDDGALVVAVPRVEANFSPGAILRGRLAPTRIDIVGPAARMIRSADGRLRFGLDVGAPAEAGAIPGAGTPGSGAPGGGAPGGGAQGAAASGGGAQGAAASGDGAQGAAAPGIGAPGGGAQDGGAGVEPAEPGAPQPDAGEAGFEAIDRILDGLAGTIETPPGLEALREVSIRDLDLVFRNARTGSAARLRPARITLTRGPDGLRGRLSAPITLASGAASSVEATATRARGASATRVDLTLGTLPVARLAAEVEELAFLKPFDAPVSGALTAVIEDDGRVETLEARLSAGAGSVHGAAGEAFGFDALDTRVTVYPGQDRLRIDTLEMRSPTADVSLAGTVWVAGERLSADLRLAGATLRLPAALDDPLTLDEGALALRGTLEPLTLSVRDGWLRRGALQVGVSARLGLRPEGLDAAIRAEARDITVEDLKSLWPTGVGGNARAWVRENLIEGHIPQLVAHARVAGEALDLGLDFTFDGLRSQVLKGMPLLEDGAGIAHVTATDMVLDLERGSVAAAEGLDVSLAGSRMVLSGFDTPVTPADIDLAAEGPLAGVLAVIDRPPLRLVSKLGLPAGGVRGAARLQSRLAFPLLKALPIEDVVAEVDAALSDVSLALRVPDLPRLDLSSPALVLSADTSALRLEGPVSLSGDRVQVRWDERYGANPGRQLQIDGRLSLDTLAAFGVEPPGMAGAAPRLSATLTQSGRGAPALSIDADLAGVAFAPPAIDWQKPADAPGRLRLDVRLDDPVMVDRLTLTAPGLELAANARFDPGSGPDRITVERLVIDDRADVSGTVTATGEAYAVAIAGPVLSLDLLDDTGSVGDATYAGAPFELSFDVDRLSLTPEIEVRPASGRLRRAPGAGIDGSFEGRVGGIAPLSGTVRLPAIAAGDGTLVLRAPDAGAFLRALAFSDEARGGTLRLEARLPGGRLERLRGLVEIDSLQLTEASTLRRIVVIGGAEQVVETGDSGIAFRRIEIPFGYADGTVTLRNAIATGPKLAVRLSGTVDQRSRRLDMAGVASPAYAVSSFLDDVPLLGRILTGERGEGVLALTFTVDGPLEDPQIDVDPLSILVPGILRNLITKDGPRAGDDPFAPLDEPSR